MVHPKDKVKDEEKTELIYRVPCKNCSSSYVGETGMQMFCRGSRNTRKKWTLSQLVHRPEPPGQGRAVTVTHKSAITDHAVEENHVIDWDKAKLVDREA